MSRILEAQIETSPYALSPSAETLIYHSSDDSSELHLKLPADKLLRSRSKDGLEFEGALNVKIIIASSITSTPLDTIDYTILAQVNKNIDNGLLYHVKTIPLPEGFNYKLTMKFTDKKRNNSFYATKLVRKSKLMDRENFFLKEKAKQIPYFASFMAPNREIELVSNRVPLSKINIYQKPADLTLPPPPSSSSKNKTPERSQYTKISPDINKNFILFKNIDVSDILIESIDGGGLTFLVRPAGYPEPSSVFDMIQPLRYISSRKEFEKMENNSSLKQALDNFWLNCGDTKERSKELIAIFYARVEESNRFFTSYKSGWRTDRGLINIVFGSPSELEITEDYEIWTYGEKTDLGTVQFKFNRMPNEFCNNYFELERNPIYKSEWARRVGAWRNGRIYN